MMKVKITWQQLIYLHDAFLNKDIPGTSLLDVLLREHCGDFCMFLGRFIDRGHKTYRITFTRLQVHAFMLIWMDAQLPPNNGYYVILELIGIFDKESKQIAA